jgi:hypothetical protein
MLVFCQLTIWHHLLQQLVAASTSRHSWVHIETTSLQQARVAAFAPHHAGQHAAVQAAAVPSTTASLHQPCKGIYAPVERNIKIQCNA